MKIRNRQGLKPGSSFFLSKWFLDGTSERGEAFIGYIAKLQWQGIEIPYTSLLLYDPFLGPSLRWRLRRQNWPEQTPEGVIQWHDPPFGTSGVWRPAAAPLRARLFESPAGYIDWACFQPRSKVELNIADGPQISGWGYAECLTLTVPPWVIPMEELRWGRYGSDEDHLVWIELRSGTSRQWVWYNGQPVPDAIITDESVTLPAFDLHLSLDRSAVLEAEQKILNIVKLLLPLVPGIKRSMPLRFLSAQEYKWRSRGVLRKGRQTISEGWAIHEWVDFRSKQGP